MPTDHKIRPVRPMISMSTAELKSLARDSLNHPQRLAGLYFELQFRKRKAARELREYVRFLLASLGHPFPWPDTEAMPGHQRLPQGVFEIDTGLLSTMGYRVGMEGIGEARRRDILDDIYEQELFLLKGHPQEREWGKPRTATRLRKMALVLASLTKLSKRMRTPPRIAIAEWESDLRYLKKVFYVGRYDFTWPSTLI